MKTYSLELRHAVSKRKLNASPGNRLAPLRMRLDGDAAADRLGAGRAAAVCPAAIRVRATSTSRARWPNSCRSIRSRETRTCAGWVAGCAMRTDSSGGTPSAILEARPKRKGAASRRPCSVPTDEVFDQVAARRRPATGGETDAADAHDHQSPGGGLRRRDAERRRVGGEGAGGVRTEALQRRVIVEAQRRKKRAQAHRELPRVGIVEGHEVGRERHGLIRARRCRRRRSPRSSGPGRRCRIGEATVRRFGPPRSDGNQC